MIKLVAVSLWCAAAALGASYATARWKLDKAGAQTQAAAAEVIEQRKTRVINVPMIVEGQVKGYIVAQFIYVVEANAAKALPVAPENFLIDEAFRIIYADETLDFRQLKKFDLTKFAQELHARVKQRLKSDAVREVLVGDFNFVSREQVRQ